jgi:sortase A
MPDRRTVDELSIEELERILMIKKRAARQERVQRLAAQGRLVPGQPLPPDETAARPEGAAEAGRESARPQRHGMTVEPLEDRAKGRRKRFPPVNWRSVREVTLLVLEVSALIGLIAVLAASFLEARQTNLEYARARERTPAPTPTPPINVTVLPGGHAPPVGDGPPQPVPEHLRDWIAPQPTAVVAIPTPESQPPTRIVIPKINVDAPVLEGDDWETLKKGVGHHIGTANPGERGNVYISGHNDIYGQTFRRLEELDLGDEVVIYAGPKSYRYVVREKRIVEPKDVSVMYPTTEPILSLQTCYPFMVDTHRLVVIARLEE